MKKTTRKPAARPSRNAGSSSRAVSARKRPAPSRTAATSTASGKAATKAGSRRCEAPNCNETFRPKSDRQIYCSPACKVRAFYWAYKEQAGERYAARYERKRRRSTTKTATTGRAGATGTTARATRRPAARKRTTRK